MAQLAIKRHPTRGREVIQLLEMLGGNNIYSRYCGYNTHANTIYYIDFSDRMLIKMIENPNNISDFIIFTLEEFFEKFPYKVGDKVKCWINGYCSITNIKDIQWDSIVNEIKYRIQDYWYSTMNLQPYKDENVEKRKYSDLRLPLDDDDKLATEVTIDGNKITPPENYLIGKITKVDNGMLIEFVKKQLQYPKDYKECCEIIGYRLCGTTIIGYKSNILKTLQELLIARDAYWKIAGEQMGLGEPWKPDWDNLSTPHEFIKIYKGCFIYSSRVLVFPTKEMRDAFYENFKYLIEQCKELL